MIIHVSLFRVEDDFLKLLMGALIKPPNLHIGISQLVCISALQIQIFVTGLSFNWRFFFATVFCRRNRLTC